MGQWVHSESRGRTVQGEPAAVVPGYGGTLKAINLFDPGHVLCPPPRRQVAGHGDVGAAPRQAQVRATVGDDPGSYEMTYSMDQYIEKIPDLDKEDGGERLTLSERSRIGSVLGQVNWAVGSISLTEHVNANSWHGWAPGTPWSGSQVEIVAPDLKCPFKKVGALRQRGSVRSTAQPGGHKEDSGSLDGEPEGAHRQGAGDHRRSAERSTQQGGTVQHEHQVVNGCPGFWAWKGGFRRGGPSCHLKKWTTTC